MRRLINPHLVQFLGVSVTEGRGMLLMELMAGNLSCVLRADEESGGPRRYGWYNRGRNVALQIASALMYLHQHNVVVSRPGVATPAG